VNLKYLRAILLAIENLKMIGELLTELENYRAFHEAAVSGATEADVLVFSTEFYEAQLKRSVGGFADRLKGMLSCALMAILTERVFLVDWRTPFEVTGYFDTPKITWNDAPLVAQVTNPVIVNAIDNENYSRYDRYIWAHQGDPKMFEGHRYVRVHTNILGIRDALGKGELLQKTEFGRALSRFAAEYSLEVVERELLAVLFNYLLSYRPRRAMVGLWNDFHARRRRGPIIGVHFRSGGNGAWPNASMDDIGNVEQVFGAVVTIGDRHFGGSAQLMIASDSVQFRTDLSNRASQVYPTQTYSGEICHYERSKGEILAGVDFALLEFICLSRCDFVLHGEGGFGLTAARIGARPHAHYKEILQRDCLTKWVER